MPANSEASGDPAPTTGTPDPGTGGPPADTTGDTTTTGSTTTGSTTADPTTDGLTTTGPTTTDPATTDPAATEPGTTGEPDTTTTAESTTTDTEAPGEPITKAWYVQSLPPQIRVQQTDPVNGLCRGLLLDLLARGGTDTEKYIAVEQPEDWGVRYVFVHDKIDKCLDPYDWYLNDPAHAKSASGSIIFYDIVDGHPSSIDLDVKGIYNPLEPWIPEQDDLTALAVPVDIG